MNLMSEYIEQLRSLAASLIGGSLYFNERQRIFTQLIAGDDTANLICDSVTRNKIDLAKDLQCQKPMNAENIKVAKKIIKYTSPKWIRVASYWNPRGGIPIDVIFQRGKRPKDVHVEDLDIPNYSGR